MKRKLRGIYVATIFGIPITLDYSWFLIFGLIVWSLSGGFFAQFLPESQGHVHWLLGIVAALLLFASILLHELSHSILAKLNGIPIGGITLHVFGGVAEMKEEVENPVSELKMAAAGPLMSVVLGIAFGVTSLLTSSPALKLMFGYLGYINIILAVFNMIPGFPLDGGRIFRALLWMWTGNYYKATKWATNVGGVIAYLFMFLGFWRMLGGSLFGGIWLVFIGFFLKHATESSYRMLVLKRGLTGLKAKDLMVRNVDTVPPTITLQQFVDEHILQHRHHSFPVLENGKAVGIITLHNIKEIPRDQWPLKTVGEAMTILGPDHKTCELCDLATSFMRAADNGIGRLIVVDEQDNFVGYLSFRDLETLVALRTDRAPA